MSTQFKKFLCFVVSLCLSNLTAAGIVRLYLNSSVSKGFGGELIVLFPIVVVSIFLYYFLLKRIFKITN